jgi:hypothetical protein
VNVADHDHQWEVLRDLIKAKGGFVIVSTERWSTAHSISSFLSCPYHADGEEPIDPIRTETIVDDLEEGQLKQVQI